MIVIYNIKYVTLALPHTAKRYYNMYKCYVYTVNCHTFI